MNVDIKDKIEEIVVGALIIPFIPVIVVAATGMWLIDKYMLTDEDRYQLGKKW